MTKLEEIIVKPEMKTVSILFTTYTDFISRLVGIMSGFNCTHVSIALDEENEYLFYFEDAKGVIHFHMLLKYYHQS